MARASDMLTLVGDKKLANTMLSLPTQVFTGVMRGAIGKGLAVVKKQARKNAKPGEILSNEATGEMRKAIKQKTHANRTKETVSGRVFVSRDKKTEIDGKHHNPGAVAHLVEFGHQGPSPAPPHPFLRPALDTTRPEAKAAVTKEAKKRLPKAVARAKKINRKDATNLLRKLNGKGLLGS